MASDTGVPVTCRAVKWPWILSGAPLIFKWAPGNIQGNIDSYAHSGGIPAKKSQQNLSIYVWVPLDIILLNQSYNERRVAEYAYIAPVSGIHNLKQAPTNMNFVKVQKPITIGDCCLWLNYLPAWYWSRLVSDRVWCSHMVQFKCMAHTILNGWTALVMDGWL